jgi:tryptophan synthase alpha chain
MTTQPRIAATFDRLKAERRSGLITYTMACDPYFELSQKIINALPAAGADILEIGIPFSDPMADGPTIQRAANRALKADASVAKTLELCYNFRKTNDTTPIILMGYYNPILKYGLKEFANDAKLAGVDGVIIVDLPIEEDAEILPFLTNKEIACIKLIAPTTPEARVAQIAQHASGFIYYISMAGVTGTKNVNPNTVAPYVQLIKQYSKLPVAVGFGIKTPQHARDVAIYADAVVVGSALVERIENYVKTYSSKSAPEQLVTEVAEFVASVKSVL